MTKRLDRVLSNSGAGTRNEVRKMIKAGRVCVSGTVQCSPEAKICPEEVEILLDGKKVICRKIFIHHDEQARRSC